MTQKELVEKLECGDIGEVEFFELALAAGMSLERIGEHLRGARFEIEDDEIHKEEIKQ